MDNTISHDVLNKTKTIPWDIVIQAFKFREKVCEIRLSKDTAGIEKTLAKMIDYSI